MSARVALTLRTLGGMTTGEIARAFLVADPAMGKRIVRAKRKIADAHIPYRVPADGELLCRLMPGDAEVWGLSALMLLHDARRAARVDPSGRYVALDEQDRSLWDRGRIGEGLARLERAVRLRRPGEYQLQAAITALQIQAPDAVATDWAQIAELFGALVRLNPSLVIELNRAVAAAGAARAYERAIALSSNAVERAELERRLSALR